MLHGCIHGTRVRQPGLMPLPGHCSLKAAAESVGCQFGCAEGRVYLLQSVFEVKQVLQEAQVAANPVNIWDDSDFIEDHQLHGMDEEDLQDFIDSITNEGIAAAS